MRKFSFYLTVFFAFILILRPENAMSQTFYYGTPVMIGTTTQTSELDVFGNVTIGSYAGTTAAPTNGMIVSGKVGIGTNSPIESLQIGGGGIMVGNDASSCSSTNAGEIIYTGGYLKLCNGSAWVYIVHQ